MRPPLQVGAGALGAGGGCGDGGAGKKREGRMPGGDEERKLPNVPLKQALPGPKDDSGRSEGRW